MICKKCKSELIGNRDLCYYCAEKANSLNSDRDISRQNGSGVNNGLSKLTNLDYKIKKIRIKERKSKKNDKFRLSSKKMMLGILSMLVLFILLGIVLGVNSINSKYKLGISYMDSHKYEEAIEVFNSLQGSQKSFKLIRESEYLQAKKLIEEKEYSKAIEILSSLYSYRDADKLIMQSNYLIGKQYLEIGSYEVAIEKLRSVGNYEDAETLMNEAQYELAKKYMEAGRNEEAFSILYSIYDYEDSDSLIIEVIYLEAIKQYEKGDYSLAENMLSNISTYKDSEEYFKKISFIKSFQGTWEDGRGFKQVIFVSNKVVNVISPYSYDTSVDSRKLTLVNNELKDELGTKYYIDKEKLYKVEGNNTEEYKKIGASTDIPQEKPSPQIGMTAKQVEASNWGPPEKINKTTINYGVKEQWVYNDAKYIYLEEGIVIEIQE